jgi:hypothetical protein
MRMERPNQAMKRVGEQERRRQMAESKNKYTTAFGIPVGELNNKWDNCRPYHTKEVLP